MAEPRLADFTIFGHRGAAGLAPENTPAAFEAGIEAGLRWMELDVQAHPEALIVFHDHRLERCAGVPGAALKTPLRELQALDAGSGQRIPLLEELLDQLHGRAALNIELKAGAEVGPRTAEALRAAMGADWAAEDLLVSSFDHRALADFHASLPAVPVAPLFDRDTTDMDAVAASMGSRIVHLHRALATPDALARLTATGLRAHVFTVNDAEEAETLRTAGAGGVFTDHPERFRLVGAMSQKRHSAGVQ